MAELKLLKLRRVRVVRFIEDNYLFFGNRDLKIEVAHRFDKQISERAIKKILSEFGLKRPRGRRNIIYEDKWNKKSVAFVKENINKFGWFDLCTEIRKTFKMRTGINEIRRVCKEHQIQKKVNIPNPEVRHFLNKKELISLEKRGYDGKRKRY